MMTHKWSRPDLVEVYLSALDGGTPLQRKAWRFARSPRKLRAISTSRFPRSETSALESISVGWPRLPLATTHAQAPSPAPLLAGSQVVRPYWTIWRETITGRHNVQSIRPTVKRPAQGALDLTNRTALSECILSPSSAATFHECKACRKCRRCWQNAMLFGNFKTPNSALRDISYTPKSVRNDKSHVLPPIGSPTNAKS